MSNGQLNNRSIYNVYFINVICDRSQNLLGFHVSQSHFQLNWLTKAKIVKG